jgi:hypothetical protein
MQEAEEAAVAGAANEAERQQVQQRCKDLEAKVEEARRRIQVGAVQHSCALVCPVQAAVCCAYAGVSLRLQWFAFALI